jgi:hypothetical protein
MHFEQPQSTSSPCGLATAAARHVYGSSKYTDCCLGMYATGLCDRTYAELQLQHHNATVHALGRATAREPRTAASFWGPSLSLTNTPRSREPVNEMLHGAPLPVLRVPAAYTKCYT